MPSEYEESVEVYILIISPDGSFYFINNDGELVGDDGTYPTAISNAAATQNMVVSTDLDRCGRWGVYWLVTSTDQVSGNSGVTKILAAMGGLETELNYYWCDVSCDE